MLEYFISTHGARKGLADTALRTADSGYLTRRLVDVAQDVIVREGRLQDEGQHRHGGARRRGPRNGNLIGRVRGESSRQGGHVLVEKNQHDRAGGPGTGSRVHSKEEAEGRPCRFARCSSARPRPACRAPATASRWRPDGSCELGDAVGIIAAQSIGEPGTQLTMRTFHTGGVAGADITHGLPRVVELFEARKPKGVATCPSRRHRRDRGGGEDPDGERSLDSKGEEHAYTFPRGPGCSSGTGQKIESVTSSSRARSIPPSCSRSGVAPRPSVPGRRCRPSTSPRASTSTTSTSS